MRLLALIYRRLAVFVLGVFSVWLIVFVFRFTDSRVPTILALSLVYALAAYVILPRIVRMSLKILQRRACRASPSPAMDFRGIRLISFSWASSASFAPPFSRRAGRKRSRSI